MMQFDRISLGRQAKELGFVRDTFEKICRLVDVLSFIGSDTLLSDVLALKGGTAINLTIFDLGQLELDIPNKAEFPGASITICQGETGTSTHATRVMELLLKVAPNAQYYCTTSDNGFEQAVEWLIDQGVNIITNSAGSSATGQYTAQEVWLDHLAINHSVHFVKSAGNNGNYITRPGMAYNIITVGAANSSLNGRWTNSSFNEYGTLGSGNVYPDKPDIIAPGESWFFDTPTGASGSSSGTSYAAPIVTGVVALMMQSRPALKTLQDSVKSCLLASINNSTYYEEI